MTATADSLITDERFEVHNPANGRVIATVPVHAAEQVAVMAAGLRAAQPEWEAIGPRGRARHLLDWLDWIMDNERRLLDLDQAESGKSWGDVAMETSIAVEIINYITKNLDRWLADQKVSTYGPANVAKRLRVHFRPHQLVGVITPWNAPLGMPMLDVPFALAAGAAVLTKPSEATPLTWVEVVRGWREEIGAPPVLGCATGLGATGAAVVDQVDMIQFTGSTRTGRAIAIRAAERLIPCGLELGGKDAMIVLDDAPVDRAVAAAVWGGFYNCGQACISIERVYVHEKVYDEFVTKLAEQTAALRVGVDTDHSFTKDVGALVTPAQVDIVERHVNDAVARGARVLTGGERRPPGNYFLPTVLVDVDHSMDCMTEETFGPTLPVMKVRSEDEAISLANDSPYGLSGSVWTSDPDRAVRVAKRLETGGVSANAALATLFQSPLPFGGWKESGLGARLGGAHSVQKYCRTQAFVADRVTIGSKEPQWYPYTPTKARMVSGAIRLLGMRDWRRRLGLPSQRDRSRPNV
ncbi:aldehyde dehydrogenase family protein [Mycobacterium sp. Aquia_216]|uniref:aldehyde dehydrogenase family protein n=1 Tax=Mycobacterium sp. Aquia_216 TaxID=2991729 RepID=UPI00227AF217|nr:aldehyde dehydrogenase family protein [Mycobacterium sp. Aquia_216]WAJ45337.1 aldehyde dehydrogenase family protein [Mycobacterium sp. Aquia_216]